MLLPNCLQVTGGVRKHRLIMLDEHVCACAICASTTKELPDEHTTRTCVFTEINYNFTHFRPQGTWLLNDWILLYIDLYEIRFFFINFIHRQDLVTLAHRITNTHQAQ